MPVKSAFLHLTKLWLRGGRWVVVFACLCLFAWSYLRTFHRLTTEPAASVIQEHEQMYLESAIETRSDLTPDFSKSVSAPLNNWLPHRTDGVVRPLWPWLAAWQIASTHPKRSDASTAEGQQVIRNGRRWLAGVSLGFLLMLGLAAARAFSVPAALLAVLTIGFGVLLPSATLFAPDALFQILFLLTWVCCFATLKRNSLWLYGMIGILSALANLALPTTSTLVLVFVGVSTLRWLWGWVVAHWSPEDGGTTLWIRGKHWLGMVVLVVCHLVTMGPMLSQAHEKLGGAAPFFWRWFDDEGEMRRWTAAHQTRDSMRKLTADEVPSYANYVSTHPAEAVHERLMGGAIKTTLSLLEWPWNFDRLPSGRGVLSAALAAILMILAGIVMFVAPRAHHAGQALHPETAPMVLFTILASVICTFDFGWDVSVLSWGNRHLALYPPLVLSLIWACEALVHRARRRKMRLPVFVTYELVMWLLCAVAAWHVIVVLQQPALAA